LSTSSGLGASQVGLRDAAGNVDATNLEDAITEIYTDFTAVKDLSGTFDENTATTTGLTWGYKAGNFRLDNVVSSLSAGTIGLTNESINYVEIDPTDSTVKRNGTGFTTGRIPLRTVTVSAGSQVTSVDQRAWFDQTVNATTAAAGTIRIAASAEVLAGTVETASVTPKTLSDKLASPGNIGGTSSGTGTFTTLGASTAVNTSYITATSGSIPTLFIQALEYTTAGASVSNTEIGYLDGVTSSIQTQLNAKLSTTSELVVKGMAKFSGVTGGHTYKYNVNSISDDGTGHFTVYWETDFATAAYVVVAFVVHNAAAKAISAYTALAGAVDVRVWNTSFAASDCDDICILALG